MANKFLSIAVVLCLLAAGVYFMRRQGVEKPPQGASMLEQVKQDDVKRMAGDADVAEKAKSLRRMAFQNPEKAREFSKKLVSDPSPALRAAAFETAGYFQGEEWDKIVLQGLADTEVTVRLGTLKGLLRQPTAGRASAVENFLGRGNLTPQEKLWANVALMYASSGGGERKAKEDAVLNQLPRADRDTQAELSTELFKVLPNRPELLSYAEKIVGKAEETPDFLPSFRYMSAYSPERLAEVLMSGAWPESRAYLFEVAEFLGGKCPKNWVKVLQKAEASPGADEEFKMRAGKLTSKCGA
jgi:hypothetical protein